jgi:hypothetical protein
VPKLCVALAQRRERGLVQRMAGLGQEIGKQGPAEPTTAPIVFDEIVDCAQSAPEVRARAEHEIPALLTLRPMHPLAPDSERFEAGVILSTRQGGLLQLLMAALQAGSDERGQILARGLHAEAPAADGAVS